MIRVLIVDDDALVRSGLQMMLSGAPSLEVVGEAADGREVLGAVDLHRPDVVLMDIRMPQLDGIAATRLLTAQPRPPAVLVLTTFDADELVLRALQAGAAGCGGRRRLAKLDPCGDPHSGLPRLLDKRGELRKRRLRRLSQALAGVLAQHTDHAAQLLESGPCALSDHAGRFGDLLGRSLGAELERAGVDGQQ